MYYLLDEIPYEDGITHKLDTFLEVNNGWAFGEGIPASKEVIRLATKLYQIGKFFIENTDVFLGTDGAVAVVFYKDEDSLEFIINPNLTIDLSIERGIGFDFDVIHQKDRISLSQAEKALKNYKAGNKKNFEWNTSDSFIITTMIKEEEDLEVRHFEIRPLWVGAYPSSITTVSEQDQMRKLQRVTTS